MTNDKYTGIRTEALIIAVQNNIRDIKNKKKKLTKTKAMIDFAQGLREMQYELSQRLKMLNRFDPKFFPIGSYVDYVTSNHKFEVFKSLAVVTGHTQDHVIIKEEDNNFHLEVEPQKIKLKYLREII